MDFSKESIFTGARSHKKFDGQPLTTDQLRSIYELAKYAPTANNSCPLRIIFVNTSDSVSYPHLRAHETGRNRVCRLVH